MYSLGVISVDSPGHAHASGRDTNHILGLIELSRSDFDALNDANTALSRYLQQLGFLNVVHWNLEDYLRFHGQLLLTGIRSKSPSLRTPDFDLNRRLMNLLGSIRAYLDHTEADLNRRFGETHERFTRFKTLTGQ